MKVQDLVIKILSLLFILLLSFMELSFDTRNSYFWHSHIYDIIDAINLRLLNTDFCANFLLLIGEVSLVFSLFFPLKSLNTKINKTGVLLSLVGLLWMFYFGLLKYITNLYYIIIVLIVIILLSVLNQVKFKCLSKRLL